MNVLCSQMFSLNESGGCTNSIKWLHYLVIHASLIKYYASLFSANADAYRHVSIGWHKTLRKRFWFIEGQTPPTLKFKYLIYFRGNSFDTMCILRWTRMYQSPQVLYIWCFVLCWFLIHRSRVHRYPHIYIHVNRTEWNSRPWALNHGCDT